MTKAFYCFLSLVSFSAGKRVGQIIVLSFSFFSGWRGELDVESGEGVGTLGHGALT